MLNRIRKDDLVVIISGRDKGKQGTVIELDQKHGLVKVRGISIVTRHIKPRSKNEKGMITKEESFLPLCKVMPACPDTKKGCRIRTVVSEDGKKIRASHRTGAQF